MMTKASTAVNVQDEWYLIDAAKVASEHPDTFHRPPSKEIGAVRPGDFVKLLFGISDATPGGPDAERMWVIVSSVENNGQFSGRLRNEPHSIRSLKVNDEIAFEANHIIDIMQAKDVGQGFGH